MIKQQWQGREATQWTGTLQRLSQQIPYFEVRAFAIENANNTYKDLIVRKPLETETSDYGNLNIMPDDYIPLEAVSRKGYKLVQHHFLIEAFNNAFTLPETLNVTLKLSIYGARMQIEFSVPHYKRDAYIIKVVCQNSVDRSMALTINLFLQHPHRDIPFDGFHHTHTKELLEVDVHMFLETALERFRRGTWDTDHVDRETIETVIEKKLTQKEVEAAWQLIEDDLQKEQINLLRFREILTMLVDEGTQIFREQKLVRFAKLTNQLNQLIDPIGKK